MEEACAPALESESLINEEDAKELPPLSLDISPVFCKSADRLLESKQIPSFSPSAFGGAARSVVSQLEGQQVELPRLNDGRRLHKSLGSAMRVKLDDGLNSSVAAGCGVVPLPRSGSTGGDAGFGTTAVAKAIRLGLGTRVDVNKGKTREVGCVETESNLELCGLGPDLVLNADKIRIRAGLLVEEPERMGSATNPSSLEQSCSMNGNSVTRDNLESRSFCDGGALSSKLGVNSSVHAFDDIRRMRKSWGSALRVKISEDLEAFAGEVGSNIESGTNKIKSRDVILGSLSPLSEESSSGAPPVEIKKEKNAVPDSQGPLQDEVVHMKPEVARVSKGLLAGACTQTATVKSIFGSCEGQPSKRIREKPSTNGFPSTPIIIVSANARRSMSLGYLEKGTDNKMKSSNCSGSVQQNHPVRASSVCQPAEILSRVRSSKVGKENSTVQSPSKSKVNTGLFLENKTQQSVLRMSMPAGAVSRQAVGGGLSNKSKTILERSGEVQVPVSSQLGSRKSCVSNQRKSVGHHKSPSKRMPVTDSAIQWAICYASKYAYIHFSNSQADKQVCTQCWSFFYT
ncbi:hypothetical protein CY35_18G036700 [Sphagnum magellanicum]|nr:hypothetical protein CY35_18G036700 [Sphagnum magellanicum]